MYFIASSLVWMVAYQTNGERRNRQSACDDTGSARALRPSRADGPSRRRPPRVKPPTRARAPRGRRLRSGARPGRGRVDPASASHPRWRSSPPAGQPQVAAPERVRRGSRRCSRGRRPLRQPTRLRARARAARAATGRRLAQSPPVSRVAWRDPRSRRLPRCRARRPRSRSGAAAARGSGPLARPTTTTWSERGTARRPTRPVSRRDQPLHETPCEGGGEQQGDRAC